MLLETATDVKQEVQDGIRQPPLRFFNFVCTTGPQVINK